VAMAGDSSAYGVVLRRSGSSVRVDFSASLGIGLKWVPLSSLVRHGMDAATAAADTTKAEDSTAEEPEPAAMMEREPEAEAVATPGKWARCGARSALCALKLVTRTGWQLYCSD
jgi:hypothetical protein